MLALANCYTKPAVLCSANLRLLDNLNATLYVDSSPKLGKETVCFNESVSLACRTHQQVLLRDVTWHWLNQSKEGNNITVQATLNEVVYTCKTSTKHGLSGQANITVVANGELVN